MSEIRTAVLAGSWYPEGSEALATEVDRYLDAADPAAAPAGRPLLAVVPHAGYFYSGESAGRLYGLLAGAAAKTVFILAPNHRTPLERIALSGASAFATPLGDVAVDSTATARLAAYSSFQIDDDAHEAEHAVEIQLPFLQRLWPDRPFTIVPILVPHLNDLQRSEAAGALADLQNENTLLVVSSDFTHYGSSYGYVPFRSDIPASLERLDSGAILKILGAEPDGLVDYGDRTGITMCGLQAAAVALGTGMPRGYEAALIDYRRSADREGDYSLSVSYASILMTTGPESAEPSGS